MARELESGFKLFGFFFLEIFRFLLREECSEIAESLLRHFGEVREEEEERDVQWAR